MALLLVAIVSVVFYLGSFYVKLGCFLLVLFPLLFFALQGFIRVCFSEKFLNRGDYVGLVIVLVGGVVTRFYRLNERSLWLDDAIGINNIADPDLGFESFFHIVKYSAEIHQPPLDYVFQTLGMLSFGVTPLGSRIHAVLFGIFAIVAMYLFVKRVTKSSMYSGLAAFLLVIHPLHIYYSQEPRHYSAAVFFSILFFWASFEQWCGKLFQKNGLFLFSVTSLFLLTIGMQAPIVVFIFAVAWLAMVARSENVNRESKKHVFFSLLASAVLFLPYQIYIFASSRHFLTIGTEVSNRNSTLWELMYYSSLNFKDTLIYSTLLVLGILVVRFFTKKIRKEDQFIIAVLVSFYGFLLCTIAAFYFMIDWFLQRRYIIVAVPLAVFVITIACKYLVDFLRQTHFFGKVGQNLTAVVIFSTVFFLPLKITINSWDTYFGHDNSTIFNRRNWQSMYSYIEKSGERNDVIHYVSNAHPKGWNQNGLMLQQVYFSEKSKVDFNYISHWKAKSLPLAIKSLLQGSKESKHVFFIVDNSRGYLVSSRVENSKEELEKMPGFVEHFSTVHDIVVKVKIADNKINTFLNFYEYMEKRIPKTGVAHNTYAGLSTLYCLRGERDLAVKHLEKLKQVHPGKHRQQSVEQLTASLKNSSGELECGQLAL